VQACCAHVHEPSARMNDETRARATKRGMKGSGEERGSADRNTRATFRLLGDPLRRPWPPGVIRPRAAA
jgi:hypothetical protein